MKKIQIICGIFAGVLAMGMMSCTSYLDKEADSTVSEETAFQNYRNFQGFIEEMYNCIPDKEKCNYCTSFNWGEDEIMNTGMGDGHFTRDVDLGNFRAWSTNGQEFLFRPNSDPASSDKFKHSLWPHAWYCIRKANIGIANLSKMVGTPEEKRLIEGQLYFFRAWWYEELMQWFGGLPYVDHPIGVSEEMKFKRLTFQECADKCAADFRKAADLLPNDWESTSVGQVTSGKNGLRITKVAALGYLGKVLLWAASPLMENGAQAGASKNGKTYMYNTTYAQRAAEAFGEALTLVESGQTPYKLVEFDFANIYDHEKSASATSCYSEIFYTTGQGWKMPGGTEAIMRGPSFDDVDYTSANGSNWNFTKLWGTKKGGLVEHDNVIHQPTANYINYAYGMADGTPAYILKDGQMVPNTPEEGGSFDPSHPFKNRTPRFYHDIIFDGFKYVLTTIPDDDPAAIQKYCGLYTNGYTRGAADASRTGYYTQKLVPHQANKFDGMYNWGGNLHTNLCYMRLADLYLMYAEACAAIDGASGHSSNFAMTAEEAINVLRDRVGEGHVAPEYVADPYKFMDEVRRERAVELAFEGFRFNDLQRWLLLTEYPYNIKTSQEFDRVGNYDFTKNDPALAEVANFREEKILQRYYEPKHYWFPLLDSEVYLYEDFKQNTGW